VATWSEEIAGPPAQPNNRITASTLSWQMLPAASASSQL
jgi:hypothetical protein